MISTSSWRDELDDGVSLRPRRPRRRAGASERLDELGDSRERVVERLLAHRLLEIRERAGLETLLPPLDAADDVDRNVPRAAG